MWNSLVVQVSIEAIYNAIQTIIYSLLLFSMMGFEWKATNFLWFYYFILMCFVYFTMYGMMIVALTPGPQIAAIAMSFFLSFWNLFSGFMVPRTVSELAYFIDTHQEFSSIDSFSIDSDMKCSKSQSGGDGITGYLQSLGRSMG